jgi:transglycosylase-like protein with SLT domain
MRVGLALAIVAASAATAAAARTVTFPLVVDYPILESAFRRDIGMTEGESLELWGTPGGCHWAVADEMALDAQGGKLRVKITGSTVVGFRLLWFCISPIAWQGSLTIVTRPVVGRDWQLRLETAEVEARDPDGNPSPLTNAALQTVKDRFAERLGAFRFDLGPPVDEAKALIRAVATSDRAKPVLVALDSVRPIETIADPDGIRVTVAMEVPDTDEPAPAPEAKLSDAEVAAWEDRIDRWDAFLVFVVKTLGLATTDRAVRNELLDILLDARRELVDVLRQGPVPGTDPVRNLFLSSWDRLRVQTRRAIHEGRLGERAWRFVTFLAAGDALAALDQAGPGLGLEISADGLRRLARTVDPDKPGDPIAVSDKVDDELRNLFDFEDPTEQSPPPASSTTTTDAPSTTTTSTTLPLSWLWSPRAADAAPPPDLGAIGTRLYKWVPEAEELREYHTTVETLLTTVAAHRVDRVDARMRSIYGQLVPAVAWQESCWRQFVEKNGAVTFMLSATGDVGIMQVNRRVWRGFFDVRKLEWDAVYNAAAGAEILVQLLVRGGTKEGAANADNAARATYSAYNGGPKAFGRWRSAKPSKQGRAIDAAFWEKYRQVAAGTAGDLVLCM